MLLAEYHLEFFGRSLWWAAIGETLGAALIAYGLMARRYTSASLAAARRAFHPQPAAASPTWLPILAIVAGAVVALGTAAFAWQLHADAREGVARTGAASVAGGAPGGGAAACIFLLLSLAASVFLFYRASPLPRGRRAALMLLRLAGTAALVLLLFRPELAISQGPRDAKPVLAVVVDASASMGYSDAANQPNRFRQAAIAVENTLLPRLTDRYRVEVFAYDGRHTAPLEAADELDTIVPDGNVTDLGAAVALGLTAPADTGKHGGAAAGGGAAILFSDGIHNGTVAVDAELTTLAAGVPVHTVRVGSSELEPSAAPDIAVLSLEGPQTSVVNNQVVLTASIKSTAMSDRTVRVSLFEKQGSGTAATLKSLDEQRLVLRSGASPQTLQFKYVPDKVGRVTLRVQVPVDPAERSDANNQQDFSMLVTDPKLGVLYVEGRVRPEVGPLRRGLEQDPNLSAVTLVQTAPGRFEMSGARGEMAGAGTAGELKGLPTTLAQWKRFKVIVLGDLDSSFLNAQQQKDLEQAVREGAGLLMIGGQNSFAPGGWGRTTLADLLPVSLEKVTPPQINTPFVPKLTGVGALHPIFRNIAGYFIGPDGAKTGEGGTGGGRGAGNMVPELRGCVALGPAKAGASVLALHPTEKVGGEPAIVLAVQQYGKGRTAAFAADTTYLWSLFLRGLQKESPYNRFWGQMIRWLATEENLEKKSGASVTAMLAKERFEAGDAVPLRAAVTDAQGQATNFAKTWAEITGPDGKVLRLPMAARGTADDGTIGIYEATDKPMMAGTYKVVFGASKADSAGGGGATGAGGAEKDLGRDETSFLVMPAAGERDILAAQPRTLEAISRQTGGIAVDLPAVDGLVDRLLAQAPQSQAATTTMVPLYNTRAFFLLFIAFIAVEWFLRRRWQLI